MSSKRIKAGDIYQEYLKYYPLYITIAMERSNCLGCKTHFQEGDKLPAESITIELKNYPFPIKENKHRWNLLKTICSFLNSKGGTIFIGAQDTTGEVRGIKMQRKDMDDFRIFIQQVTQRILPKLDLSDREDVVVHFVPIVNKGKFTGKYLIKVIVKQGITTEMYCFPQKIQLQDGNSKKTEQFQVHYGYKRTNAANIEQFKQYRLIQEIKNRLTKPPQVCNCFHENCNPQPVCMSMEILKIGFSNITLRHTRQILNQWSELELNKLGFANWLISYDVENKMIVIELEKKSEFTQCEQYIDNGLSQLNDTLEFYCKFVKRDIFLDCLVYENVIKQPVVEQEEKKEKKKFIKKSQKIEQISNKIEDEQWEDETKIQQVSQKKQKTKADDQPITNLDQKLTPKNIKQISKQQLQQKQTPTKVNQIDIIAQNKKIENGKKQNQNIKQQKKEKLMQNVQKFINMNNNNTNIGKKFSYTFTHINPKRKNELKQYIEECVKCKKNFEIYENSLEVFFESENKLQNFCIFAQENAQIFHRQFGFKECIKMGINVGWIEILNYDKNKGKQLMTYLKFFFGKDLKQILFRSQGKKQDIVVELLKPTVCLWLDRLLTSQEIKNNFKCQGSGNNVPKMKFILVCQDPFN